MKEELITFETAKLAKEKGFNEQCSITYNSLGKTYEHKTKKYNANFKKVTVICTHSNQEFTNEKYSAPTQSLLQKWLREIHKIIVSSNHYEFGTKESNGWYYSIGNSIKTNYIDGKVNSYEEALESGLQEALKLI